MVDLTGGLGVDFSYLSRLFDHAIYMERQSELCSAMCHNAPLLGLNNVEVREGNSLQELEHLDKVDFIFIDPARRACDGRKTVLIEDCEPDVVALLPLLQKKSKHIMLKLSPMLDISRAVGTLGCVSETHIVGSAGECKELLLLLSDEKQPLRVFCIDGEHRFSYLHEEESQAKVSFSPTPLSYLYEPSAVMMKSGAFRLMAQRFSLMKLHPNTHLYTSDEMVENFPGRSFRVLRVGGFGKRAYRDFRQEVEKANLTVRNFPASVAELRKRLKLKEGGEEYWFATTLSDESHVLIACQKSHEINAKGKS